MIKPIVVSIITLTTKSEEIKTKIGATINKDPYQHGYMGKPGCEQSAMPWDWTLEDRPGDALVNYRILENYPPDPPPSGICIPYEESFISYVGRMGEIFTPGHCN